MASIYDPQDPDKDLEKALFAARLSPEERAALRSEQAQQLINKGMENVTRGALGMPVGDKRAQAAAELKALAQQRRPGTAEFYEAAADIFRKYGMVAEAEQMMARAGALEVGKGEQSEVMKLQRTRDILAKRVAAGDTSAQGALDAVDRRLAQLGTDKPSSQQADPELVKLQKARDAAREAGDEPRAAEIQKAIDALLSKGAKSTEMTPYQQKRIDLAESADKRKQEEAAAKKEKADEAAAGAAASMIGLIDDQLSAAQRLLKHPGLSLVTGPRAGLLGRVGAAMSDNAAGAYALRQNVEAQVFIKALQDLKATSERGASGLGQLTEREGDKIQNAKVALDAQQPTEQYKRTLTAYINQLRTSRAAIASQLQAKGKPVPAEQPVVSDVPRPRVSQPDTSLAGRKASERTPAAAPAAAGTWSVKKRGE